LDTIVREGIPPPGAGRRPPMQRLPWMRVFPFLAALCASAGCTTTGFGVFGSAYSGLTVAGIDVSDAGEAVGYVVYPELSADPNDPASTKKSMAVEFSAGISDDDDTDVMYTRFHVLVDLLEKPAPAEGRWYYPYLRAGLGFEFLAVDRWEDGYYESTNSLSVVGSAGLEAIWERHIAFFIQAKTSLWLGDISKVVPQLFPDPRFGMGLDISSGIAVRF
jgi:hypothetical protein